MNPLQNDKVKEFFGVGECRFRSIPIAPNCDHLQCMALRVLQAMSEPINEGDRYLAYLAGAIDYWDWEEWTSRMNSLATGFHPTMLRLPSQFQKQPEKCEHKEQKCMTCGIEFPVNRRPAPADPVEEKIDAITIAWIQRGLHEKFKTTIRELVAQAKRQALNDR